MCRIAVRSEAGPEILVYHATGTPAAAAASSSGRNDIQRDLRPYKVKYRNWELGTVFLRRRCNADYRLPFTFSFLGPCRPLPMPHDP